MFTVSVARMREVNNLGDVEVPTCMGMRFVKVFPTGSRFQATQERHTMFLVFACHL